MKRFYCVNKEAAQPGEEPRYLGKYELLQPLATGGMARIYLARTKGIGAFERYVVLKLILPERATDETSVSMFLDEARLAATLNHQNVAQVFEVGAEDGVHYLAMEYVHGADLRGLLSKAGQTGTRIPLELALTIVSAAAAGLGHAHDRKGGDGQPLGIVHRDVSPSNVMVGYDGSVKVLDFGIAKATERSIETQSGVIKGKFAYMSPEQCRGRDVDRRSDVFALGIILYEATTQHRCFRADSDFDTMHRIVTGDVVRPTRLVADYPADLEAIVLHALAIDPKARYQTAVELLEALETVAREHRWSLSTTALGRFMRQMFGDVPEPWLTGPRQTATTVVPPAPEGTISSTDSSGARARLVEAASTLPTSMPSPLAGRGREAKTPPPQRPSPVPGSVPQPIAAQPSAPVRPSSPPPTGTGPVPGAGSPTVRLTGAGATGPVSTTVPANAPRRPTQSVPVLQPTTLVAPPQALGQAPAAPSAPTAPTMVAGLQAPRHGADPSAATMVPGTVPGSMSASAAATVPRMAAAEPPRAHSPSGATIDTLRGPAPVLTPPPPGPQPPSSAASSAATLAWEHGPPSGAGLPGYANSPYGSPGPYPGNPGSAPGAPAYGGPPATAWDPQQISHSHAAAPDLQPRRRWLGIALGAGIAVVLAIVIGVATSGDDVKRQPEAGSTAKPTGSGSGTSGSGTVVAAGTGSTMNAGQVDAAPASGNVAAVDANPVANPEIEPSTPPTTPTPIPPTVIEEVVLRIGSTPSGADVILGKKVVGQTPFEATVTKGQGVRYLVREAGYSDRTVSFSANADDEETVVLTKRTSTSPVVPKPCRKPGDPVRPGQPRLPPCP